MPLDVARDEWAQRNDVEALTACVVQCPSGKPTAETTALPRFVNLGVREGDPALPAPVSRESDHPGGEPKLIAARLRHVDHLCFRRASADVFELLARAKILDQLPLRIRLACVAMIDEPAPVLRRELPRIDLA